MATFELESSLNSLPDTTIIPNYEGHSVVQCKLMDFSIFRPLDARQVFETLNTYFTDPEMLVIAHSDSPQPIPMHQMTLEALNAAMLSKLRSEAQPLLGDEHKNVYDDLKAMVEVGDDSSPQAMVELLQLCFRSVLEAIACASIKKGALYTNPFTQKPILLLGNRSLFITDKTRVNAALSREKKAKKAAAMATKATASGKSKRNTAPPLNPQGKPRRTISDDEEEEAQLSEATVDDVSCHGGDGDSPYDSEWERSPRSSARATPVLQSSEDPVQLTLTPAALDAPRLPLNIQLAPNQPLPLMTIPPGILGTPSPLGGTIGSVPMAASTSKTSSKRKSKKSGKDKKSKKAKKTRSRSSSESSVSSVEVPPPRPSADQVFLLCLYFPLSIDTVWVIHSFQTEHF